MTTETTAKSTSRLIIEQLMAEGVGQIFMAPRSASSPLCMNLAGAPLKKVEAPTEASATFMAIGHA